MSVRRVTRRDPRTGVESHFWTNGSTVRVPSATLPTLDEDGC
jgi:hypothetical protein